MLLTVPPPQESAMNVAKAERGMEKNTATVARMREIGDAIAARVDRIDEPPVRSWRDEPLFGLPDT